MHTLFFVEPQYSRGMNQSDYGNMKKCHIVCVCVCLTGRVGSCNAHSDCVSVMPSTSIITSSSIRGRSTVVVPLVQRVSSLMDSLGVPCCFGSKKSTVKTLMQQAGLSFVFVVGCNAMKVIVPILFTMMIPRCNYCLS
jgi:hypothetical protein